MSTAPPEVTAISWELVAAIVAPIATILGVTLGAFLTHKYNRDRDHLELKRDVLRRLMGYRWQLAPGRENPDGHVFTALNEIPVVFAGDVEVEKGFDAFRGELDEGFQPEHFMPLAQAMAKSARVPHKRWNEEMIAVPLAPPPEPNREQHP